MKLKHLASLIFVGAVIALAGSLGIVKASQHNRQTVIGVLVPLHHPALRQIYSGMKDELAAEGYHNGKNIKIVYENANGDQSNLHTMADKLINSHAKILVGIATPACQALANGTKSTPIVMGDIGDPKGAGLIKNEKHPEGNVTGVHGVQPIHQQLALVKKFMPKMKKLGVIYTSSDDSATAQYKQMAKEAKKMHINLKAYTIANSNDLNQVSQQMLSEVDAVIVPSDNTIASSIQTLIKNANAVNKPVFPGAETMVKQGGVATVTNSQYGAGRETGKFVAQLLKGKQPANLPVKDYDQGVVSLNVKQAKKLGLTIPAGIEKQARKNHMLYK